MQKCEIGQIRSYNVIAQSYIGISVKTADTTFGHHVSDCILLLMNGEVHIE